MLSIFNGTARALNVKGVHFLHYTGYNTPDIYIRIDLFLTYNHTAFMTLYGFATIEEIKTLYIPNKDRRMYIAGSGNVVLKLFDTDKEYFNMISGFRAFVNEAEPAPDTLILKVTIK